MTVAEIKVAAQHWYERQLERCAAADGDHWLKDWEWIEAYVREERAQRLVAQYWRANA